jgi:hypothetical protein
MRDPRFPRPHLTARNSRSPRMLPGWWIAPAAIVAALIWTGIAAVVLTVWP